MSIKTAILFISLTFLLGCNTYLSPDPKLLSMDFEQLVDIRQGIDEKSPIYMDAYQHLCREAEEALNHPVYSVTQKNVVPPSGDKHDYMSQGPYWWPNPETENGLPYINRDGIRNPEVSDDNFDKERMSSMTEDVSTLSLAWFFSGNETYAERAKHLIYTWYLNPETSMNPNLQYAQAIPGITEGRGIGIIDTRKFIYVIDAIKILEVSPIWNKKDSKDIRNWFSEYLFWLENSQNGKDEQAKENNHGTWYDVQTAYYALFTGNMDRTKEIVSNVKEMRINTQIDFRGRQERELSRTRAFSYSTFNIEALMMLGKIGESIGVDLWKYQSPVSGNIKMAVDFLLDYVDNMEDWPYQQISEVEWDRLIPLVIEADRVYNQPRYKSCLDSLQEKITSTDRLIITKL